MSISEAAAARPAGAEPSAWNADGPRPERRRTLPSYKGCATATFAEGPHSADERIDSSCAKGKIFSFIGSRMALVTPGRPDTETLLELSVHEFRTPVSVLVGYSRMLLAEHFGPLTEKQRQLIGGIQKSSHRLVELTKEMSELLKLESNTAPIAHDEVDLESVVQEAADAQTEGRDRGVTLEHQSEETSLPIEGDRRRLLAAVGDMLRAVLREQGDPTAVVVRTSRITIVGRPMAAVAIGWARRRGSCWKRQIPRRA